MTQIVKRHPQVARDPLRCHRCYGTGRAPCQICHGSGEIRTGSDRFGRAVKRRCPGCFGARTHRCPICGGAGFA